MIPKVIHWCWLSDDKLPPLIQKCLATWKEKLPSYTIKCWTTKEFNINSVPYVKAAFEARRWAFCADYIRAYALYQEGGIYLDSDIEVIKSIDDLLANRCVMCIEDNRSLLVKPDLEQIREKYCNAGFEMGEKVVPGIGIQAAVLFSEKGHPFFKSCIEFYSHIKFEPAATNANQVLIAPSIYAHIAENFGFEYKNKSQLLDEGIRILPSFEFCNPIQANKDTRALHLENHSWIVISPLRRLYNYLSTISFLRRMKRTFLR